jgi:N-acetylmuramic acid 6-phosphate etherase
VRAVEGLIALPTEDFSSRYADIDLWPTEDAVKAMLEGQLAAAAAVQSQATAIAVAADEAAARLGDAAGRLIYVGAGTSGRLALQDGVELGPTYGWDNERTVYLLAGGTDALISSVEGAEDDAAAGEKAMREAAPAPCDVVVGVAASGSTPFTIAAVRTALEAHSMTIGMANNAGTPLLQIVAHPILLDTGAEVVAGSTRMKAGTAQKIALNLFSTATMLRLGRVYDGRMIAMSASNAKLRRRAAEMISEIAKVGTAAAEAALDRAGGDIRLAALIALGISPEQAVTALAEAGGNLRNAIRQVGSGA